MSGDTAPLPAAALASAVAWLYVVTNCGRVVSYVPQIVAVWRSRDGARAISLVTWSYWLVSHLTATLYGVLVVRDTFFVAISMLNVVCCGVVTALAAHRRRRGVPEMAPSPR